DSPYARDLGDAVVFADGEVEPQETAGDGAEAFGEGLALLMSVGGEVVVGHVRRVRNSLPMHRLHPEPGQIVERRIGPGDGVLKVPHEIIVPPALLFRG